jgi:hypothetical protein
MNEGRKILTLGIKKAEETVPGVKDRVKEMAPGLTERVERGLPIMEIPARDVGGEDIKLIPRYEKLIRVSYAVKENKKIIVYRGKIDFRSTIDFYQKEMTPPGFAGKALRADSGEEVHQFKNGRQDLEFKFKKLSSTLSECTELTIREL